MIVTSNDVGLEVKCNYNLSNRTVSHNADLEVGGELPGSTNAEQTIVQAPNVTMRITDRYTNSSKLALKIILYDVFLGLTRLTHITRLTNIPPLTYITRLTSLTRLSHFTGLACFAYLLNHFALFRSLKLKHFQSFLTRKQLRGVPVLDYFTLD